MGAPAEAKHLGVNLRTLYAIIDSGELPAFKIRRAIRLKRADVDAFLERCRVQPGTLSHLYPPGEYGDPPRKPLGRRSRPKRHPFLSPWHREEEAGSPRVGTASSACARRQSVSRPGTVTPWKAPVNPGRFSAASARERWRHPLCDRRDLITAVRVARCRSTGERCCLLAREGVLGGTLPSARRARWPDRGRGAPASQ